MEALQPLALLVSLGSVAAMAQQWKWTPKRMTETDLRAVLNYMDVPVPHDGKYHLKALVSANYPIILSEIEEKRKSGSPLYDQTYNLSHQEDDEAQQWKWTPSKSMTIMDMRAVINIMDIIVPHDADRDTLAKFMTEHYAKTMAKRVLQKGRVAHVNVVDWSATASGDDNDDEDNYDDNDDKDSDNQSSKGDNTSQPTNLAKAKAKAQVFSIADTAQTTNLAKAKAGSSIKVNRGGTIELIEPGSTSQSASVSAETQTLYELMTMPEPGELASGRA